MNIPQQWKTAHVLPNNGGLESYKLNKEWMSMLLWLFMILESLASKQTNKHGFLTWLYRHNKRNTHFRKALSLSFSCSLAWTNFIMFFTSDSTIASVSKEVNNYLAGAINQWNHPNDPFSESFLNDHLTISLISHSTLTCEQDPKTYFTRSKSAFLSGHSILFSQDKIPSRIPKTPNRLVWKTPVQPQISLTA